MSEQATKNSRLSDKYIVGVTGGIGSGKSTITRLFEQKNIDVVDADIVAREVVAVNSKGLLRLTERFSDAILLSSGELDRQKLREIVFNDTQAKTDVNNILHPIIREEMLNQLSNTTSQYCLLVAPLLIENQLNHMVDCCLVIDVSEAIQLSRTLERDGGNADTIKGIMAAQVSRQKRIAAADDIIDNSTDIDASDKFANLGLLDQVNDLHKKYLENSRLKLKN